MRRTRSHEVSMGSMADIAFLLLIFFLMATTIESDLGILRKLPPPTDNPEQAPINERNILVVLVNRENQLMVEGEKLDIKDLRKKAKQFIINKENDPDLPEIFHEEVKYFGIVPITSKHVISLRSDRGTSYNMYVTVQNELEAAYNELRDEQAQRKWNTGFKELSPEKKEALLDLYPMKISEAEPNF